MGSSLPLHTARLGTVGSGILHYIAALNGAMDIGNLSVCVCVCVCYVCAMCVLCVCVCVCAEGAVTKRQWPGCCTNGNW